jgi:integrase
VRWIVGGEEQHETFATKALAETFRSDLIKYQRQGLPFDKASGLPEPMLTAAKPKHSVYTLACAYADAKWNGSAPKSRKSVGDVLACIIGPLIKVGKGEPTRTAARACMYGWVAVKPRRDESEPDSDLAQTIRQLEKNAHPVSVFDDPEAGPDLTRACLESLATKLDGTRAARNTIARRRAVFYNFLEFAVENGAISRNPLGHIKWRTPKKAAGLAKQTVPSWKEAESLLVGVREQGAQGERLEAFFALMMFAALRPAEALATRGNWFVSLPDQGWGTMVLHRSTPRSGVAWSDTGRSREDRGLKHRAEEETREVPVHSALVPIVRGHIDRYHVGSNDRLFRGPRGGLVDESVYLPLWKTARQVALGQERAATRLAWRPYDLRHFAISFWLLAGISVTQAALWAGNSEAVIWAFYAKLMSGQEKAAMEMIDRATRLYGKPGSEPEHRVQLPKPLKTRHEISHPNYNSEENA